MKRWCVKNQAGRKVTSLSDLLSFPFLPYHPNDTAPIGSGLIFYLV